MNWKWWRKARNPNCKTTGEEAADQAERSLNTAKDRWPEVREQARNLRDTREANGFGEAMLQLFKGAR